VLTSADAGRRPPFVRRIESTETSGTGGTGEATLQDEPGPA
jgi:hypothetical protein